jgi:hypothetical protein
MLVGVKALAIVGATAFTVRFTVADAVPVGALALATPVALLGKVPGMLLVTKIVTVQEPEAGMVNPVMLSNPVALLR